MEKTSDLQPLKPCGCTFCSQFYFIRIQKYKHKKNLEKRENYKGLQNPNPNKEFTIGDLDTITHLKSLNCDTQEISKQTNLSYSIIDYVINMIYKV